MLKFFKKFKSLFSKNELKFLSTEDIRGLWEIKKFYYLYKDRPNEDVCVEPRGFLSYLPNNKMTATLYCTKTLPGSYTEKIGGGFVYSGDYVLDRGTGHITHKVEYATTPDLKRDLVRKIAIKNENTIVLIAAHPGGDPGVKVVVEAHRVTKLNEG